ncbi:MAG TPA: DUF4147 domain-containing protein [Patescibacteria group bacterium]
MTFIKNFNSLATTPGRKLVLTLVEEAFSAISPQKVMDTHFVLANNQLIIQGKQFDLAFYKRIFLIGFGKGSSGISKFIEQKLGDKLTKGFDIDVVDETFSKISYTKGTHPLPSQENLDYTQKVLESMQNLSETDLVLVVICGGGSVLFEKPKSLSLEQLTNLNSALLKSGATISEMNVIRKHVSDVKGGKLAKKLYPASVVSLIFSDVPGNDLSVIASGPTVKDPSTKQDMQQIIEKYQLQSVGLTENDFEETPKDENVFAKVSNILMVSNVTALTAMQQKAKELGANARILSDRLEGNAKTIGKDLVNQTNAHEILLAGGETTVHVTGKGNGGRNQSLVLGTLPYITDNTTIIVSFDSDGWDFMELAGAIGDYQTIEKAKNLNLNEKAFLDDDNSLEFFQKVGDGINTGKLESNVSDLMIVYKE